MTQVSAVRDRAVTAHDGTANPQAIDYPDLVEAGDLLVLFVVGQTSSTPSASGWDTLIFDSESHLNGTVFTRTADGSEGGTTFEITNSVSGTDTNCLVWSVREDLNPGAPEAASASAASGTSVDPPSLSPSGGDRLYLWLVPMGINSTRAINDWPSLLDERINRTVLTGQADGMASGERLFESATFDPGAVTINSSDQWLAFNVAIPVDAPSAGGFPVIETTSQGSWTTGASTQTLTLPTGVASGDLLVVTLGSSPSVTATIDGFDVIIEDQAAASPLVRGTMLQRVADGTEGASVTVDFSSASWGSYLCRRISAADNTKTDASSDNTNTTSFVSWPSLTPADGADNILWLTDVAINGDDFLVGWPVNYGALPLVEQDGTSSSEGACGGALARNQTTTTLTDGRVRGNSPTVTFTVAIYPGAAPPSAPTNPAATTQSATVIQVTWDDVSDETGYRVERSLNGSSGWTDVSGNLAADTVSYNDTGLTAETQYFYRVIAFNAEGDSDPSSTVNATTSAASSGNRMGGDRAIRRSPRTPR